MCGELELSSANGSASTGSPKARERDTSAPIARNIKRLARLDIAGMGQVIVHGHYAYVGHMDPPHAVSIIDISNPKDPKIVSQLMHDDPFSHSHKVRIIQDGNLMIINMEQYNWWVLRKSKDIDSASARLLEKLGRKPNDSELARELEIKETDLPEVRAAALRGYSDGGFKIYDIKDKSNPRLIVHHRTGGVGAHRFCAKDDILYLSTQVDGFHGNIIVNYDLSRPDRPEEVSRWWMPGQNVAQGEKPDWIGYRNRVHHALVENDRMYVACWYAGLRIVDISRIANPVTISSYNYHPATPAPTHTVMPVPHKIKGRRLGLVVDEEQQHFHGQPRAGLWIFDFDDERNVRPISQFHVSDEDTPWSDRWFGAHQYGEQVFDDNLVFVAWLAGGLRVIDISDPYFPDEAGVFIPEPGNGQPNPISNDVARGENGLIYLADRLNGLDILEYVSETRVRRSIPRLASV